MGTVPGRRPDTGGEERREGQRATPARSEPGLSGLPRPLPRWPLLCWFAAKRGLRGQEPQTSGVRRPLCPGRGRASHPGGPRSGTPRQHWAPASLDWCAQEARAACCHSPPRGPARGGPYEVLGLVRRLLCPAFHPESHGGCVARCAASTALPPSGDPSAIPGPAVRSAAPRPPARVGRRRPRRRLPSAFGKRRPGPRAKRQSRSRLNQAPLLTSASRRDCALGGRGVPQTPLPRDPCACCTERVLRRPPSASGRFPGTWPGGAAVLCEPPALPLPGRGRGLQRSPAEGREAPARHRLPCLVSSHAVSWARTSERGGPSSQCCPSCCRLGRAFRGRRRTPPSTLVLSSG